MRKESGPLKRAQQQVNFDFELKRLSIEESRVELNKILLEVD